MKTRLPSLVRFALLCSLPSLAAGWGLSSLRQEQSNEEPVQQVIQAIDSPASPAEPESPEVAMNTAAAIFDSLHQRTVASFVATIQSFGFSRILRVEDMRHSDLWTLHPGRDDGFEVSLIGLDRNTPVRFERVPPPENPVEATLTLNRLQPHETAETAETVPLDDLDQDAIAQFGASKTTTRAIFPGHEAITAFGPIRSSEACLQCHDGDAGDLLGLFRYTFPVPSQPLKHQLAGNP